MASNADIIEVHAEGPVTDVRVTGTIAVGDLPRLRERMREVASSATCRGVILDLSGIDIVDSTVIGFLISAYRTVRSQGRSIALVGVGAGCLEALCVNNLNRILPIFESRDEARRSVEA